MALREGEEEPVIRGADALGLAGTDRDETRKYWGKDIREQFNKGQIGYNTANKLSAATDNTLTITPVEDGYLYWDQVTGEIVDEFDVGGYSKKDRNRYMPFIESDSGSISKSDIDTPNKAPTWAWVLLILLGLGILGFSGYSLMSSVNTADAGGIELPDEEDLFDADSEVTYTGPEAHEIDWEEEFANVPNTVDWTEGGVVVPSADIYSEMIATGQEEGSLVLPESPLSTWYERSAEIGAEQGNAIIASHVNNRDGQSLAPFSRLNQAERGTLVGVQDTDGNRYIYEVTEMQVYERVALPEEMFRTDGDHKIHLVTCSGQIISDNQTDGTRVFEHNLVVTAELVEEL